MSQHQTDLLSNRLLQVVVGALWLVSGLLAAVGVYATLESFQVTIPTGYLLASALFGLLAVGLLVAVRRVSHFRRVDPPSRRLN
ncbi:hypothetical protein ACKVMT_02405 [Halobacteriales archaeon Cl-PHB]